MASPLLRLNKVFMVESTSQILTCRAVIDWRNVLSLEDDGGSKWDYDHPRTYFVTNHGEFYAEGELEHFFALMQEWEAFGAQQVVGLPFSKH